MNRIQVVSIEPTGTFIGTTECLKVTLRCGNQEVTCDSVLFWDNPDQLGLAGTFEEWLNPEEDFNEDMEDME